MLGLGQRKSSLEVPRKKLMLPDDGHHEIINLLLSIFLFLGGASLLFLRSSKSVFSRFGFLFGLRPFEVFVVEDRWDLERDGNMSGSSDDIGLIHSTYGNTIETERTVDKEKPRLQLFQEDASFSSVRTGKEDQYGSRNDRFPQTSWAVIEFDRLLLGRFLVITAWGFFFLFLWFRLGT